MWHLRRDLMTKCTGKLTKRDLFRQDNVPPHTFLVSTATVRDCDIQPDDHAPYSPDLALSDYHRFSNVKRHLAENQYRRDNDVIFAGA